LLLIMRIPGIRKAIRNARYRLKTR
jgi:hypothetical protein